MSSQLQAGNKITIELVRQSELKEVNIRDYTHDNYNLGANEGYSLITAESIL